jgi:carboxyl-terminal processing protease
MDDDKKEKKGLSPALESGLKGAGLGLLLGLTFIAGLLADDFLDQRESLSAESYTILEETDSLLDQYYLREMPDENALVYGAAEGYVSALEDPYTYFVEPQTAEVDQGNLAGRFGGIGAQLQVNEAGEFVIVRVYEGNPAAEGGLQADDVIIGVDGTPVEGDATDLDGLIALIRGEVGTEVTLSVRRGTDELDVRLVRAEVLIPSVFWEMTENPRVGYIRITRFTDRAPEEVRTGIAELREQGMEALIMDLRGNGGGLVDASVDVLDEFVEGGVVLIERQQGGREDLYRASRQGEALELPLVVLVDGGSASASEIVAGALQDRGRATLVGQQTFGKGSVQLIFELSDGSSLHVTNSEWLTPSGDRIDTVGLTPDIPVEPQEGVDTSLLAALEHLAHQTAEQ